MCRSVTSLCSQLLSSPLPGLPRALGSLLFQTVSSTAFLLRIEAGEPASLAQARENNNKKALCLKQGGRDKDQHLRLSPDLCASLGMCAPALTRANTQIQIGKEWKSTPHPNCLLKCWHLSRYLTFSWYTLIF